MLFAIHMLDRPGTGLFESVTIRAFGPVVEPT